MSPIKRKRPHDAAPESPLSAGEQQQQSSGTVSRRATRHASQASTIAPLSWQADPEPRRRRRRLPGSDQRSDLSGSNNNNNNNNNNHNEDDDNSQGLPSPTLTRTVGLRGRAVSVGPQASGGGNSNSSGVLLLRATTNQAHRDPGLKPARKLVRHQRHTDDEEYDDPEDHHDGDANGPVATKPIHVGSQTTNLRHRGSAAAVPTAVVGPTVGSSPLAAAPSSKQQPPPLLQNQSTPPKPSSSSSSTTTAAPMTQLPSRSVRVSDHVAANTSKPFAPPSTANHPTARQQPLRPARKQQQQQQQAQQQQLAKDQRKPNTVTRNIDKVVFGNVCFSTWYHSPYGTEALGDASGNSGKAGNSTGSSSHDGSIKEEGSGHPNNTTARKTKEDRLDRLYVCPCCFKYSKELVPWWQHVHLCERRNHVPGEKIYTHPRGRRTRQVPVGTTTAATSTAAATATATTTAAPKGPGRKRKGPDSTAQTVEETVEDQGEWSIWQVDGEAEGLFCQNLSLFAKLFLDNKSVFFDVVCFNYFILVHTTPRRPSPAAEEEEEAAAAGGGGDDPTRPPRPAQPPRRQIVGFFSKEKLSWDNNNLACILIFPPWQRKGLGALLMGVSYEISRREGMIGGPEKPISDLGRRGYKRFWAGEIASWILNLDIPSSTSTSTNTNRGQGEEGERDEVIVDVEECSRATWIVQDDCLAMLREMGVVEEAGMGPPKPPKRREVSPGDGDGEEGGREATPPPPPPPPVTGGGDQDKQVKEVRRVRISKDAVWNWVRVNGISLEKACDPSGFVDGYAIKRKAVEEEDV